MKHFTVTFQSSEITGYIVQARNQEEALSEATMLRKGKFRPDLYDYAIERIEAVELQLLIPVTKS